jgi:transcriptional antiterminator RfaH
MNPTSQPINDEVRWRCIRGKPKAEHLAAKNLRAAGFEAFCPRIRFQRATQRGRIWFVEALFPGYLFARFRPGDIRHVGSTAFVSQVMTFMNDHGAVRDAVIDDLRSPLDAAETLTVSTSFQPGETVDVVSGPLQGTTVFITQILPGAERVRVLLEFLGRKQEFDVSILSLVSQSHPRAAALSNAS